MEPVASRTKLPSYLQELEIPHEEIVLAYYRKNESSELPNTEVNNLSILSNSVVNNLSGCPLEVDLNVLPFDVCANQQLGDSHLPLDLKGARNFINKYNDYNNKNKKMIYEPIFCICDGENKDKIVVLGSHKLGGVVTETLISVKSFVDVLSIENNLDELLKEHHKSVGSFSSKVNTKIKCVYELHGSRLNSDCLLSGLWNGSILFEASWKSLKFTIPENSATIKMNLQSVVGYENSIFHPFFEDLVFLQNCFEVLNCKQPCEHDTSIEFEFKHTENVESILDLLKYLNVTVVPTGVPKTLEDVIQHSQNLSFTDRLWNIVKYCKTVGDVKNCFDDLFNTISDMPLKTQVLLDEDDTETVIGKIINNMFSKTTTLPFLSYKQSIELLINLGIYKLKKNYFLIINWCDLTIGNQLQRMWNDDVKAIVGQHERKTLDELNFGKSSAQLNFISWVHVILEFLQLIVEYNTTFFDDNKLMMLKYAFDKFMGNNAWSSKSLKFEKKQIFDLSFPLTQDDIKLIYGKIFSKWQLEIVSNNKNSSVKTTFHFSKKPVFPSVIYKCLGDENLASLGTYFYVTLMESFSDRIS